MRNEALQEGTSPLTEFGTTALAPHLWSVSVVTFCVVHHLKPASDTFTPTPDKCIAAQAYITSTSHYCAKNDPAL